MRFVCAQISIYIACIVGCDFKPAHVNRPLTSYKLLMQDSWKDLGWVWDV